VSSFERLPSVVTWIEMFSPKTGSPPQLLRASPLTPNVPKRQRFIRKLKSILSKQDKMLIEFEQALQYTPGSSNQHVQLKLAQKALRNDRDNAVRSLSRAAAAEAGEAAASEAAKNKAGEQLESKKRLQKEAEAKKNAEAEAAAAEAQRAEKEEKEKADAAKRTDAVKNGFSKFKNGCSIEV
jgi:hypothetical protein